MKADEAVRAIEDHLGSGKEFYVASAAESSAGAGFDLAHALSAPGRIRLPGKGCGSWRR